jgi:hypothetical protein
MFWVIQTLLSSLHSLSWQNGNFSAEKHVVQKARKKKGVFSGVFRTPQQCVDDFVVANSRSDMKRCLMVGGLQREKTALKFSTFHLGSTPACLGKCNEVT